MPGRLYSSNFHGIPWERPRDSHENGNSNWNEHGNVMGVGTPQNGSVCMCEDSRKTDVRQILARPTPVVMATIFGTKIAITRLVYETPQRSLVSLAGNGLTKPLARNRE